MSNRSDAALRERLELAKKATPEGERTMWTVDPAVRGDLCIRDAFNERMLTMEDSTDMATAQHIAANHPDVVCADLEEILALRAEVERLRAREDWLITQIFGKKNLFHCPMPERHKCEQRDGPLCYLDPSKTEIRRQCWRKAADMAARGNPGNSEESREDETA